MLPGVDITEMLLVAVIAMVVFGPRDLPLMMRKFGRVTGKMRAMAFEFKQGFDELGRQAELDELRKEVADLKKVTGLDDLRQELAEEKAGFDRDLAAGMSDKPAPTPTLTPSEEPKAIAAYAGLSADHPGYDTGDAAPTEPAEAEVGPTEAAASAEPADAGVHIIPDDEVRPAPTHPAVARLSLKQDTSV